MKDIQTTTLRINSKDYEKIQIIAKRQQRSVNKQLLFIINQFINEYEKVNGKIE